MSASAHLRDAIAAVPAGRWAVGVSGGADSVALLLLLAQRADLLLHVVHLDHQTRAGASAQDARFVSDLAGRLGVACTIERRSAIESELESLPGNLSARYRAARMALFRRVVGEQSLSGVILAHHADDQAETVLHRLLRGTVSPAGLAGMSARTRVGGLLIVRPLLGVGREQLRDILRERGESWREDASNLCDGYLRNRLRRFLATRSQLTPALLRLADASRQLRDWLRAHTPPPGATLATGELMRLPGPLRRELARAWLRAVGVPPGEIGPPVVQRVIEMLADAATPARQHFPGRVLVRRSRGRLSAQIGE